MDAAAARRDETDRVAGRAGEDCAAARSDLEHLRRRMREQLGIEVLIDPGVTEVRTMRGIAIRLAEQPGLCRKTRQAIPAAIRRALEKNPEIAYKLLDDQGLFRDT